LVRGSLFLLVANLSTGVLSYLFQARAAFLLSTPDYGRLNEWMAQVGVALAIGAAAQIASSFFVWTRATLRITSVVALIASTIALTISGTLDSPQAHPLGLLTLTVAVGIVAHGLLGQLQGRAWFVLLGLGFFSLGAVRFGFTLLSPSRAPLDLLLLAFPVSYSVAALVCAVMLGVASFAPLAATTAADAPDVAEADTPIARRTSTLQTTLASSLVLAIAMALIPQVDFLNVSVLSDAQATGQFAQALLFAKAIYFASITLLQTSLPFHIKHARGELAPTFFRNMRTLETVGLGACVLGSFGAAWVGPWMASRFLGVHLEDRRSWILLSCLALTALYGHLQQIQIACSLQQWRRAATRVALFGASLLAWRILPQLVGPISVERYLVVSLILYVTSLMGTLVAGRMQSFRV
jgi:hypothetical protein